jgi:hypothetical protein
MNPHELLVSDIEKLLDEAKNKEFHDFENEKYAFPKKELVEKLEILIENVKEGKYDN